MIFVTGPLFAGKKAYISQALGLSAQELAERAVWDARRERVIATEGGGGVVPVQAEQRRAREAAGRLSCLLAARADTVVRVCCGLPQLLKGEWPCSSI